MWCMTRTMASTLIEGLMLMEPGGGSWAGVDASKYM